MANNCDIHSLQLGLGNGVPAYFGNGAIDKKNMMQMMYNIYSIQTHLGTAEFQNQAKRAAEWVPEQLKPGAVPEEGHFQAKFDRIKSWRRDWPMPAKGEDGKPSGVLWSAKPDESGEEQDSNSQRMIPCPNTGGWQHMGECADVMWYSYLVIF